MVADRDRLDAVTDLFDDCAAFVAEHGREQAFGILARQRERIGVADARRDVAQQDFAGLRTVQVDLLYFERFAGLPGDGGACLHECLPPVMSLLCSGNRRYSHERPCSNNRSLPLPARVL